LHAAPVTAIPSKHAIVNAHLFRFPSLHTIPTNIIVSPIASMIPTGAIGVVGFPGPSGIPPGTLPWQYDVSTIATCVVPFPVRFTVPGVIKQLKYCGALDVHPNVTVSFTVPDNTSPTTIFPPGVVFTLVDVPADGVNVKFAPLLNVAVTLSAPLIVTVHVVPVPVHPPPLHPPKLEPEPGVSVSVTCEPALKFALHPSGQLIPPGLLETLPVPVPASVTVSWNWFLLNVAVTLSAALIVTVHVPVPLHAPLHPANVDPLPAVAVSVTTVPLLKFALHVLGQLIPLGALTTLPVPVPTSVTLNAFPLAVNVAVTA